MIFPSTSSVRSAIEDADRVEIATFLVHHESQAVDVAILTDRADRAELAANVKIVGPWLPFEELNANSYRIRIERDGQTKVFVIRGDLLTADGTWYARIDTSIFATFRNIARRQGKPWPSSEELSGVSPDMPYAQGCIYIARNAILRYLDEHDKLPELLDDASYPGTTTQPMDADISRKLARVHYEVKENLITLSVDLRDTIHPKKIMATFRVRKDRGKWQLDEIGWSENAG